MEAHAHVVASSGGDVLNVGFGLGLIDEVLSRFASIQHIRKRRHVTMP